MTDMILKIERLLSLCEYKPEKYILYFILVMVYLMTSSVTNILMCL